MMTKEFKECAAQKQKMQTREFLELHYLSLIKSLIDTGNEKNVSNRVLYWRFHVGCETYLLEVLWGCN